MKILKDPILQSIALLMALEACWAYPRKEGEEEGAAGARPLGSLRVGEAEEESCLD